MAVGKELQKKKSNYTEEQFAIALRQADHGLLRNRLSMMANEMRSLTSVNWMPPDLEC